MGSPALDGFDERGQQSVGWWLLGGVEVARSDLREQTRQPGQILDRTSAGRTVAHVKLEGATLGR
jgi:type II secretory pathway component PulK